MSSVPDTAESPSRSPERFRLQDDEYVFPYHHIAHFAKDGSATRHRLLRWGLEYLVYLRRCAEIVTAASPSSVLDVGCGDGRFLTLLPRTLERHGVDLSERAIRFAQAFAPDVTFECRDAAELGRTFDVVTAIEVLEHVPDEHVPGFLRALAARTRPGGTVVVCVPTVVLPVAKKHYRHYDRATFDRELADSGASLVVRDVEWVIRRTWQMGAYRRLSVNRFWFAEIWPLRKRYWNHLWNVARHADETNGQHMVVRLERV